MSSSDAGKTNAACTAPSRTFILITAACDEKAMDDGDRSTSGEAASRAAPRMRGDARSSVNTSTPSRSQVRSVRRCPPAVGRYAAAVGELGQADATSPAALPLASDGPGGLRDRNQLRARRTVARLAPPARISARIRSRALVVSGAAARSRRRARARRRRRRQERSRPGPAHRAARGAPVGASRPAGEGGLGDDRPRRPVSRTRK